MMGFKHRDKKVRIWDGIFVMVINAANGIQ